MEMWRAQAIRRRGSIQPTASSIAGNTLHRIVLPRIDSLYLLSGRDLFRLEHLNIDFLHSCPSEQYFRQWLQRYENNRGAMCQSVEALYREYHAARVVRRFLRCITQKHRSLVITGSFAAACYLESHGFEAWRPGDIDLFVFDEQVAIDVETRFIDTLQRTLCVDISRQAWFPDDGRSENAVGSLAFMEHDRLLHSNEQEHNDDDMNACDGDAARAVHRLQSLLAVIGMRQEAFSSGFDCHLTVLVSLVRFRGYRLMKRFLGVSAAAKRTFVAMQPVSTVTDGRQVCTQQDVVYPTRRQGRKCEGKTKVSGR